MKKELKYKKLISTSDYIFSKLLRKIRLEKKLTTKELGLKIKRSGQQIQRYETPPDKPEHQSPPMIVFKELCLALQVDANEFLGLAWEQSSEPFDKRTVYEWKLSGDKLYWTCPVCRRKNLLYNDFVKKPTLLKKQELQCEYEDCGVYFEKLNMEK